jgi:hypothetical protein
MGMHKDMEATRCQGAADGPPDGPAATCHQRVLHKPVSPNATAILPVATLIVPLDTSNE